MLKVKGYLERQFDILEKGDVFINVINEVDNCIQLAKEENQITKVIRIKDNVEFEINQTLKEFTIILDEVNGVKDIEVNVY